MDDRMKILAVDDEDINLKVISDLLGREFQVTTASGGQEALEALKKDCPDLILLDVMMPVLNGYDLCRLIKAEPTFSQVPVIFLTALASKEAEAEALDVGGVDFISKPMDLRVLQLRVKNTLELKRQRDVIGTQRDAMERRTQELEEALDRVKKLEGIIPICMYCKSIRNDDNVWAEIEAYLTEHTDARLSHGICPACRFEHYSDIE